jgi:hypothetical protein
MSEPFEHKSVTITPEQQSLILDKWNEGGSKNPPSLNELIRVAFPDVENADGRTKEGRAVRAFLSSKDIAPRSLHDYVPKKKLKLTSEHKEYIENNAMMMKGFEIARIIFDDPSLSHVSQEARTVNDYIKTLDFSDDSFNEEQGIVRDDYKPPKTFDKTLHRINKYILEGIDKNKITARQRNEINCLIGYLSVFRFNHQINSYDDTTSRELFESSFIRYTYDKSDLTQEEVDQYIVLSGEVVISANIQRRVEHLQRLLDDVANDPEGARISMSLVEAINTAQNEYNQCVNRQHKLLGDLKQKRSDKMAKKIHANASILNLVEAWKDEESRKKMIQLAQLQKASLEKEIDNLTTMDELKSRILGLSRDEALNG